jgi:hypothetical protein
VTARIASRFPTRRVISRRLYRLADLWRTLDKDLFDPYRPELHYMRGPGPKWHEKHARAHAPSAHPALHYGQGELARAGI